MLCDRVFGRRLAAFVTWMACVGSAGVCGGAGFWGGNPPNLVPFADILAFPDIHWRWEKSTISYKVDPAFSAAFPHTGISDQLAWAFNEWDRAAVTAPGAQAHYNRNTNRRGWRTFVDLRSVLVHEIGHSLGFGHPAAAADDNRNFRRDSSSGAFVSASATNWEVMRHYINYGEYNRVLSHDELDAFDYVYGQDLDFVRVSNPQEPADIVISTYFDNYDRWADAPPQGELRDPGGDIGQGTRITFAPINFNTNALPPIGFRTKSMRWDVIDPTHATHGFQVRTRGTNSHQVYGNIFEYTPPNPSIFFGSFRTTEVGPDFKEDLIHRWSDSPAGVPAGNLMSFGLTQDVYDWTVVLAKAEAANAQQTSVPVASVSEWSYAVEEDTTTTTSGAAPATGGLGTFTDVARGFQLVGTDITSMVSSLSFAVVTGLNLGLEDLNRQTKEELQALGLLEPALGFTPTLIGGDEPFPQDFIVVLEGDAGDLPPEVVQQGNYLFLNRPELIQEEVFVFAESQAGDLLVGNYALLGTPVIGLIPEPASGASALLAGMAMVLWRRRACREQRGLKAAKIRRA